MPWVKGQVKLGEATGDADGTTTFILASDGKDPVTGTLTAGSIVPSTSTVYRPIGTMGERAMTPQEKTACEKSVQVAATVEVAEKIKRVSKDCTVVEAYVWQPVFLPTSQDSPSGAKAAKFGWVASAGNLLPDAALGKVSGTVRFLGQSSDSYLVQAGSAAPQWVAAGGAVEGTPLRFVGLGLEAIERTDVAVFTDGTSQFFTVLGGGEGSGVTY